MKNKVQMLRTPKNIKFRQLPVLLKLYFFLTKVCSFLLWAIAVRKHRTMGANATRVGERNGFATVSRPNGFLVWFNAASVGELLSVLDLAGDLANKTGTRLLFTTTTESASRIAMAQMPEDALHQFLPVDSPDAVGRFLEHWKPDLACFVESDLWPRLVLTTHERDVPLILLNARASRSRSRLPRVAAALLSQFTVITTQDTTTNDELLTLGLDKARIRMLGDLKLSAKILPFDSTELVKLSSVLGCRPVWVAASTHQVEEHEVLSAHLQVLSTHPDALLILIPRYPERAEKIRELFESEGLAVSQRSIGTPPNAGFSVYLADTIGETGLFYRLAPIAFVGGSFSDKLGGHNPFEPARLGAAVLHGPHVVNFRSGYLEMTRAGSAKSVINGIELGQTVSELLGSLELERMQEASKAFMRRKAKDTNKVLELLSHFVAVSRVP